MMRQWDVVQRGRVVTRVSFDADMDAKEVKRALVDNDGFPANIQVVSASDALRGAGGQVLGQNGRRRRIAQFHPHEFETRGVLGGRYRGRDVSERVLLTHTAWPESEDAICGTIQPGGLADTYSDPKGNALPPTCPRCLMKDPRFAHRPNEDQAWREHYARGYREAEARGLESWRAREEAARAAWSDYEARTGKRSHSSNPTLWTLEDEAEYMRLLDRYDTEMEQAGVLEDDGYLSQAAVRRRAAEAAERAADQIARRYAANGQAYYVWAIAVGRNEPLAEGPWGPYAELQGAKTFARIGATEGAHDRAVTLGADPSASGFRILRRYRAGTGARLV